MKLTELEVLCFFASIVYIPLILKRAISEIIFLVKEIRKPKRKTVQELIKEYIENEN